jgi:hypothetical protein
VEATVSGHRKEFYQAVVDSPLPELKSRQPAKGWQLFVKLLVAAYALFAVPLYGLVDSG